MASCSGTKRSREEEEDESQTGREGLQEDGSVGGVPRSFFEDFGASQAGLQDTGMLCWMTADRISWHWVRSCAISQLAGSTSGAVWEAPRVFSRERRKKKEVRL